MPTLPSLPPLSGTFEPFPDRGVDAFVSSGDADGWGYPIEAGFQFEFFGIDRATQVWRSAPVIIGSRDDLFGVPVGPPNSGIIVSQKDIRLRPQLPIHSLAGSGTRRKFFAELHSLRLQAEGMEVLAGEPFLQHLSSDLHLTDSEIARVFRRSFGEVVSWNLGGDSDHDFPADNFFNVFFAFKIDATAERPAFTLFNRTPMLVVDQGITAVPPLERVTIPQFPFNITELFFVRDPLAGLQVADVGQRVAGAGNCCAHGVAIEERLKQGAVDFGSLLELSMASAHSLGIELRRGRVLAAGEAIAEPALAGAFVPLRQSRFIDGVFVPSGTTQITSTGLTVSFSVPTAPVATDAIRNAICCVDPDGQGQQIHVASPVPSPLFQPPQDVGLGLGANAGITFDLAAIRHANPDFYLVEFVSFEGLNSHSSVGTSIRLRVFVDGVEITYADNTFTSPGASQAIRVDLQRARRFLTLVSMPSERPGPTGHGVFALMELRGFGQPQIGNYVQYWRRIQIGSNT